MLFIYLVYFLFLIFCFYSFSFSDGSFFSFFFFSVSKILFFCFFINSNFFFTFSVCKMIVIFNFYFYFLPFLFARWLYVLKWTFWLTRRLTTSYPCWNVYESKNLSAFCHTSSFMRGTFCSRCQDRALKAGRDGAGRVVLVEEKWWKK